MITVMSVLAYLLISISIIVSNKSSFKIVFSFLSSVGIYIFLSNINYTHTNVFLSFSALIHLVLISYIKFSQTGKVRVQPTQRNAYFNNVAPVVSIILASLLVLIILEAIPDDLLISSITIIKKTTANILIDGNVAFTLSSALLILIITVTRKVGKR